MFDFLLKAASNEDFQRPHRRKVMSTFLTKKSRRETLLCSALKVNERFVKNLFFPAFY